MSYEQDNEYGDERVRENECIMLFVRLLTRRLGLSDTIPVCIIVYGLAGFTDFVSTLRSTYG